jgi:hypothetical protein
MDKIPEKAILSFAQLQLPGFEFKVEVHHERYYLMLVVDCAKFDKNSDKFDESYREKLITKRPKDAQIWISNPISKIEKVNTEIEKFFGIKLNVSFSFKNYDYLEPISDKIEYAILQSSKPDVKFEFTGDGTSPMLKCKLTNYRNRNSTGLGGSKEYIEELEDILNGEVLINDNYGWVISVK